MCTIVSQSHSKTMFYIVISDSMFLSSQFVIVVHIKHFKKKCTYSDLLNWILTQPLTQNMDAADLFALQEAR